jgi:hypothetical protein
MGLVSTSRKVVPARMSTAIARAEWHGQSCGKRAGSRLVILQSTRQSGRHGGGPADSWGMVGAVTGRWDRVGELTGWVLPGESAEPTPIPFRTGQWRSQGLPNGSRAIKGLAVARESTAGRQS